MSGMSVAPRDADPNGAYKGIVVCASIAQCKNENVGNLVPSPGNLKYAPGATKAAGSIASGGTLNGGFGISSVSLTGSDYTINFSSTMADTNYAVSCAPEVDSACNITLQVKTKTTTSCVVKPMLICTTGSSATTTAFSIAINGKVA